MIGASVPFLNLFRKTPPWPHPLEELKRFPPRSLGAEIAAFLGGRGLDFLPQYETHDAIHTLLGYTTSTTGELRLQAFMWGNQSASFAGRVLLLMGLMMLPELWPQLKQDYQRGRQAQHLASWDIPRLLKEDIGLLRKRLEPEFSSP
jgi:hypothetical protein